jgi:phage repressor protein C with HTH and peptisase S24 domain
MDQLAKLAGYKAASGIQRYESEEYADKGVPAKYVAKIAPLLTGRGEPPILAEEVYSLSPDLLRPASELPTTPRTPPEIPPAPIGAIVEFGHTEMGVIPRFDAGLSAGNGSLVDESAEPLGVMLFEMQWIRSVTRAAPEHLAVVRVDGDSMRDTLADGDWVLIDRTQTRINREGIYALRIGDACWIKRISLNLRDRLVAIISDNQNYRVQELPEEDLAIIGRVVWIVGRKI